MLSVIIQYILLLLLLFILIKSEKLPCRETILNSMKIMSKCIKNLTGFYLVNKTIFLVSFFLILRIKYIPDMFLTLISSVISSPMWPCTYHWQWMDSVSRSVRNRQDRRGGNRAQQNQIESLTAWRPLQ